MISTKNAQRYCREDITRIENYKDAIADMKNVWPCHHRLELTLDGEPACRREDLIRHGMYYNRPAFELIFVHPDEHASLHDGLPMNTRGKQELPYLLSTSKTLHRAKHYYYRWFDFKFNCRKHRAYYSVENARVNLTRQWHNIIIPNAIIAREVGKPATWEDAINALAYAMTSAKEVCAVLAWDALLKEEAALPKEQRVWCKYYRSFLYYGLGQAISKDGYVYQLPKDKMIKSTEYFNRNWKLLSHKNPIECWKSPWKALNGLVAEFDKDRSMRKLTVREITEKYNVSNTTTSMFKYWLRQWISEFVSGSEYLIDDAPIFWAKPDEPEKPATPDEDFLEDAVETSETDHFNQLMFDMNYDANKAIKSGSRPVAKDQEEFELPF